MAPVTRKRSSEEGSDSGDSKHQKTSSSSGKQRNKREIPISNSDFPIPAGLKRRKVSKCSLEFIDVGPLDGQNKHDLRRLNHCAIRLTLQCEVKKGCDYAPANTKSLLLDVIADETNPKWYRSTSVPVDMILRTCTYEGAHKDALKEIDLPLKNGATVGDFIRVTETPGLDSCEFIAQEDSLVGCRDFVSQMIHHLIEAEVLIVPEGDKAALFKNFNQLYNMKPIADTPRPTTRAVFAAFYDYVRIAGINYDLPDAS